LRSARAISSSVLQSRIAHYNCHTARSRAMSRKAAGGAPSTCAGGPSSTGTTNPVERGARRPIPEAVWRALIDGATSAEALAVSKSARGRGPWPLHAAAPRRPGLGRALLEFAEAEARRAGLDSINLSTHEKAFENLALY
jgi:GNAT superfamily N-acetyltransferase